MALGQWRIDLRNNLRPGAGYGLGPNHREKQESLHSRVRLAIVGA